MHKAKCFIKGIVYPKTKAVQNRSKQMYEGFDVRPQGIDFFTEGSVMDLLSFNVFILDICSYVFDGYLLSCLPLCNPGV